MTSTTPWGKNGWTLDRIPDISGKTYVITGGNSGIGYETSRILAGKGAKVIMLCRCASKAEVAISKIRQQSSGNIDISYRAMDLSDLSNVHETAQQLRDELPAIDALMCNAGLMMLPKREKTKDGFEMQMGVNHFSHYMLSAMLFHNVERAKGRFVSVSSAAHTWGLKRIRFEDINFDNSYSPVKSYAQSKLANMLHVHELERRLRAAGKYSSAYVCHPGYAATNLQTTGPGPIAGAIMTVTNLLLAHSPLHGARSEILCATDPEAQPATFYGPVRFNYFSGAVGISPIHKAGKDMEAAKRLWELSEQLTETKWPI